MKMIHVTTRNITTLKLIENLCYRCSTFEDEASTDTKNSNENIVKEWVKIKA